MRGVYTATFKISSLNAAKNVFVLPSPPTSRL